MINYLSNIDTEIVKFIYDLHNPIMNKIMLLITYINIKGILVWVLISAVLLFNKQYRKAGLLALCSIGFSLLLGQILLKPLIHRPRPFMNIENIILLVDKPLSYSFPSTHVTIAFATIGILLKFIRKNIYKISLIILACLIAFSRLYLSVHYLSDILGGVILGLICSEIVCRVGSR